jgi:hypothetical protein
MAPYPAPHTQEPFRNSLLSRRIRALVGFWLAGSRRVRGGQRLNPSSLVDRISLWLTLSAFLIAIAVVLLAPFLAFSWLGRPFPGFLVEQTGVIADQEGFRWSGRGAGLGYPQRVTAIDGRPVGNPQEMQAALKGRGIGRLITVQTTLPDGQVNEYRNIAIRPFPQRT